MKLSARYRSLFFFLQARNRDKRFFLKNIAIYIFELKLKLLRPPLTHSITIKVNDLTKLD